MLTKHCILLLIHLIIYVLYFTEATLTPKSPRSNKEAKEDSVKILSGPVNQTVIDRNLLTKSPSSKHILQNHQAYYKDTTESNFEGLVLGFVTPVRCKPS